jgi:peptidoglycan/LPS O-acetylase OafA/YrhL
MANFASALPYRPFGALRFLLALMVLAQHGLLLLPEAGRALFYSLEMGVVAVSVFFALSGYVVSEALDKVYPGRPVRFLANRLLRILPLYICVLVFSILLDSLLYARGHLVPLDAPLSVAPWRPAVVLSGLFDIVPGLAALHAGGQAFSFIPFAWTLRIELVFYALAAAWCLLPAARLRDAAGWTLGLAVFIAFVVRPKAFPQQVLCVPFFAFGIRAYRGAGWRALLPITAGAALAFTFWAQRGHPVIVAQIPVLLVLLGIVLWLALHPCGHGTLMRWDKRLGALSYPLYIGHGIVFVAFASLTPQRGWILYACGLATAVLFAAGLDAYIDRPLSVLRTKIRSA